ncbi:MAG: HDIG domain-containing protein [Verrucomicrobia bacterium]|nr:HDIG domain-containing protein [Verrucomicrobiota bacterium]MBS0636618.1 HDIG domain-containing protein [Verrucomicrobiota bacterium]
MTILLVVVLGALALLFFYWQQKKSESHNAHAEIIREQAEAKAKLLLESAKVEAKELLLQAKYDANRIREQAVKQEEGLTAKQEAIARDLQRLQDLQKREKALNDKEKELRAKLEISEQEVAHRIEHEFALQYLQKKQTVEARIVQHAHQLVVTCLGRLPAKALREASVTEIPLPNEDIKAKIIGREGKNIKAFQQLTGATVIVDEDSSVSLSCFDPQRRDIAEAAMRSLIQDGRVTAERIEEEVLRAQKTQETRLIGYGQEALDRLQLNSMHPKLLHHLGKLKLRTSLGQNLLEHSIEVAQIMGLMAEELKLNVAKAMRMGLLHDIGKASDTPLSHALAGYRLCQECNEAQDVANGVGCHHDEMPAETMEAQLVKCADYLSGARLGARAENSDQFFKRLTDFEAEAMKFTGVKSAYAVSAGRELQVFVRPELVSEPQALLLAKEIAAKIHPLSPTSRIQVSVIRESKAVEYSQ